MAATNRLGVVADPAPGHGRYRGWISIPYLGKHGQPLSIRFRCPVEHNHRDFGHGKYLSLPDEPARMYNVRAIHEAKDIIAITEGEFDAMVLCKVGMPAVAIPGAQGWRSHHRRMLAGFNKILVFGDGDDAGADFSRKVSQSMRQAKAMRVPHGMDVTDLYIQGGAQALLDLIEGA